MAAKRQTQSGKQIIDGATHTATVLKYAHCVDFTAEDHLDAFVIKYEFAEQMYANDTRRLSRTKSAVFRAFFAQWGALIDDARQHLAHVPADHGVNATNKYDARDARLRILVTLPESNQKV